MTAAIHQVFSDENVSRLTGPSKWQLRSWDRLGFFSPRFAYEDRFAPYSRIYSFKDVVGLRTIAVLMKDYHVSLQDHRQARFQLTLVRTAGAIGTGQWPERLGHRAH
jgi:hypothetical protein